MMPLLLSAEQWRLHPTFDGNVERIIDTPDYTYFLSNNQLYVEGQGGNGVISRSLFRYDKDADEFIFMHPGIGLSENVVRLAEYNPDKKYLLVAYYNGNIDFIYDDGDIVNIPGLKLAASEYSSDVNGVSFYPEENEVYLATNFGFVVLDDVKCEVKLTNSLGRQLKAIARFGDKLVAGGVDGLYACDFAQHVRNEDLISIPDFNDVKSLTPFGNRLYVLHGEGWNARLPYLTVNTGNLVCNDWVTGMILAIERRKNGLLISAPEPVWCLDNNYEVTLYMRDPADNYKNFSGWSGSEFWVDNGREGLSRVRASKRDDGTIGWTVVAGNITPNAANAYKATDMTYCADYGMLVRNHGIDNRFGYYDVPAPDVLCSYRNGEWSPRSTTYLAPSDAFRQWNPGGIAVDPFNKNHVYSGSVFHGLLRLDLSNPAESLRIGRTGDSANGMKGYVAMLPDSKTWDAFGLMSVPYFDSYGNLWTSTYDRDKNEEKLDALEFFCWTPEDRIGSADASSFRKPKSLKINGASVSVSQRVIPLTGSSSRNIIMYLSGSWEECPIFIDHKGTIENQGDDERVDVTEFTDQDGSKVDFAYILSSYEDPSTGQVWLGHDQGVLYFRPSEIMKTGGRVTRIKVSRNDGTNLADYLLDGVSVNCILADNSGRKWFATGGGGVVVTSSDGTEVLKTYTSDNSDLPDNNVYAICYNPENNSMMISTDKGLAELFLSTAAGDSSDSRIKAYPNPVRPDYFGYVNIEGVSDNALIKIVDASGNLIKELGFAAGGEARWDLTNLNTKRVPGGVYYILASGSADGDGFSKVGKILVVN